MSLPPFRHAPQALLPPPDPEQLDSMMEAAREAAGKGEHDRALQLYERFFDRSAEDDTGSYYGVRLSFCLHEWARLGEEYLPAHQRLLWKKDDCRQRLMETLDPELFHDFKAICHALGDDPSAVGVFLDIHEREPELAGQVFRYIDQELVDFGLWSVAGTYLSDPQDAYERAVGRFAENMQLCDGNPEYGGEEFAARIRGWLVDELRLVWLVLLNTGRGDAAAQLQARAIADARLAPFPEIAREAFADPGVSAGG